MCVCVSERERKAKDMKISKCTNKIIYEKFQYKYSTKHITKEVNCTVL